MFIIIVIIIIIIIIITHIISFLSSKCKCETRPR